MPWGFTEVGPVLIFIRLPSCLYKLGEPPILNVQMDRFG